MYQLHTNLHLCLRAPGPFLLGFGIGLRACLKLHSVPPECLSLSLHPMHGAFLDLDKQEFLPVVFGTLSPIVPPAFCVRELFSLFLRGCLYLVCSSVFQCSIGSSYLMNY